MSTRGTHSAAAAVGYSVKDLAYSPMLVFYEVTRACDLACLHCRACAQPQSAPDELDIHAARAVIDQLAQFPRPPLLVFTGGDPLKRSDIFELLEHAAMRGLVTAMTPSATPLVTRETLRRLRDAGIGRLAVSLDGPDAAIHDALRGVHGGFERTLQIVADARDLGISVQINTTVTRRNADYVEVMANLLGGLDIALWSVFFLVPVGRGALEQRLDARGCEEVFEHLWEQTLRQRYPIKTTEAPHYRRYVLERGGTPSMFRVGINDGKGVMFIGHSGRVYPSGFLPLPCGIAPADSVVDIYQRHPLFRGLRNPDGFKGKCGVCEYRQVCGGSRARAHAVTGDPFESEPDCLFLPGKTREQ